MKRLQQIWRIFLENLKNTQKATEATIEKLLVDFEREGTITGYTFTSIVREMASLSEPVNKASSLLFENILRICCDKLMEEGFSKESAHSIAVLITAAIEGGIMLCLAQKSSEPLKLVSAALPNLIKELYHLYEALIMDGTFCSFSRKHYNELVSR